MSLDALLTMLELRAVVTPVTPPESSGVTRRPAPIKACTRVTLVTPENNVIRNGSRKLETDNTWRESHAAMMESRVTGVTRVQANRDAHLSVTPANQLGVTGVTEFEAFDAAPDRDTRRTCTECANLSTEGICRAANALGASRYYRPVRDQARHCEAFQARPGEPARPPRSLERLGDLALEQETRRLKVLAMLDADPTLRSAYVVDSDSDADHVIVTIAARGWVTCDIAIPRAKYDPFQLLALLDKNPSGSVH